MTIKSQVKKSLPKQKRIKQDLKVITKFDYALFKRRFSKRFFDVTSKEDLSVYKQFITTRGWGINGCPFELEWPWLSIPDMIAHKISEHAVELL
jgi:hypothetical protein